MKSRQLLYDASDLHDIPTAKAKSATIAGYANPELLGFVSGDRTARWTAARDAAKAVLDEAGSGYKTNLQPRFHLTKAEKIICLLPWAGGSKHPDADAAVTATKELII